MKKLLIVLMLLPLLCGCGEKTYETMGDIYAPETEAPKKIALSLPETAAAQTVGGAGGTIYFCDGYTVTVETFPGGDLGRTVTALTGYPADKVTLLRRDQGGVKGYRCVWSCLGEGGEQMASACILDGGAYHYAVTVMTGAEEMGQWAETFGEILSSVSFHIGQ